MVSVKRGSHCISRERGRTARILDVSLRPDPDATVQSRALRPAVTFRVDPFPIGDVYLCEATRTVPLEFFNKIWDVCSEQAYDTQKEMNCHVTDT